MELADAKSLALTLMQAHGVGHWAFTFDRAIKVFGSCSYRTQTIRLSAPLTKVNTEEQIADTILHEIAHALAGPYAKHGPEWKAIARSLGARPTARKPGARVEPRLIAVCPCGQKYHRERMPQNGRNRYCSRCYVRGSIANVPLRYVLNPARKAA